MLIVFAVRIEIEENKGDNACQERFMRLSRQKILSHRMAALIFVGFKKRKKAD